MGRKITEEEFNLQVNAAKTRTKNPVEVLTAFINFKGTGSVVECRCPTCSGLFRKRYVNAIHKGTGCRKCGIKTAHKSTKINCEQWKDFVLFCKRKKIKVLSAFDEYINNRTKLRLKCEVCDYDFLMSRHDLKHCGCQNCKALKVGERFRYSLEQLKQITESLLNERNIIVLTKHIEYCGGRQKIKFLCRTCNHTWSTTMGSVWNSGRNCPNCSHNKKLTVEELEKICDDHYKLKQIKRMFECCGVKNISEKLPWKCEVCGRTLKTSIKQVRRGDGCRFCSLKHSRPEQLLFDILSKSLLLETLEQVKVFRPESDKRKNKEIDLFVPELNFGVEFHGNLWHSSLMNKNSQTIHREKYNLAKDAGIDLIQIFEDEYASNPDLIHSIIRAKVDKPLHAYDAASCTPGSITDENLKAFMAANSFESYDEYDARVELADGSKTLAVLLWRKDEDAIRFRYVVARDTKVVGGLKRLLGTITPFYPNCALETASDARYSLHDKELEACGFTWSHMTEPDRYYCVDNYKTRIPAVGENVDNLPEIYGVGHNIFRRNP